MFRCPVVAFVGGVLVSPGHCGGDFDSHQQLTTRNSLHVTSGSTALYARASLVRTEARSPTFRQQESATTAEEADDEEEEDEDEDETAMCTGSSNCKMELNKEGCEGMTELDCKWGTYYRDQKQWKCSDEQGKALAFSCADAKCQEEKEKVKQLCQDVANKLNLKWENAKNKGKKLNAREESRCVWKDSQATIGLSDEQVKKQGWKAICRSDDAFDAALNLSKNETRTTKEITERVSSNRRRKKRKKKKKKGQLEQIKDEFAKKGVDIEDDKVIAAIAVGAVLVLSCFCCCCWFCCCRRSKKKSHSKKKKKKKYQQEDSSDSSEDDSDSDHEGNGGNDHIKHNAADAGKAADAPQVDIPIKNGTLRGVEVVYAASWTNIKMEEYYKKVQTEELTDQDCILGHLTSLDSLKFIFADGSLGLRASKVGQNGGGLSTINIHINDLDWAPNGGGKWCMTVGKALWGEKYAEVLPPDGKYCDKLEVLVFLEQKSRVLEDHRTRVEGRDAITILPPSKLFPSDGDHFFPIEGVRKILILKQDQNIAALLGVTDAEEEDEEWEEEW